MRPIDLYYRAPYVVRYPIFVITGAVQAYGRYGRGFKVAYNKLMNNLSLSTASIDELQTELMRDLLEHAYNNVPYYKRVFDDVGFRPKSYAGRQDLNGIPILTKDIIQNNFEDLRAVNVPQRKMVKHRTGGTSGNHTVFYLPKELKGDFNYATLYRFYSWAGVKFGERRVSIAGRLITKKPPYAMQNIAEHQLYICAHYLTEDNLDGIINSIAKFKPSFVQGHPSAITVVAEYMLNKSCRIPTNAIFTTSENLYGDQRKLIEEAFSCKVFDTYGMGEMVAMASECTEHNGYHLAPEYGLTEVINTQSYHDGYGELISTSLQNYAMPLIRYKTGDIAKLSHRTCPCGCRFPMLERISGRIDDVLKLRNGKTILPLTLRIQMTNAGLSDFQVIQGHNSSLSVRFFGHYEDNDKERLKPVAERVLRDILGDKEPITVEFVQEPILTKNGKQQMVINIR